MSLKQLLEEIRDGFLEGDGFPHTAAEINNGYCADFATRVWDEFRAVRIVCDEDMGACEYTHTFIGFEDKYYDAECTEGVEDWTMLPCFQR